jgi:Domain of unknown function (DUF1844)
MDDGQKGFKATDTRQTFRNNDELDSQKKTEERTCEEIAEEEAFTTILNFSMFILSLTTSALVCLGELPDPITKEKVINLSLAQQTISIIEILKEKTTGNLSEDEENLIGTVLYDLRMKYVQSSCS